ncbi:MULTISPECIES: hypothetical protein [Providencia]|uniref:hypothetical protein n=1 Tax=Providencia TaxID=586 RepID=UPI00234BC4A8|nr:hypothetical protein [Providencia sp. PROV038]
MDIDKDKKNRKAQVRDIISETQKILHDVDHNYITTVFNTEKIRSLVTIEKGDSGPLDIDSEINELFNDFLIKVGKVVDFIDSNMDYIVSTCEFTNENVIGRSKRDDLIFNYFNFIAFIIEVDNLNSSRNYELNSYLLDFNSNILLNCLREDTYRDHEYFYYKYLYINKINSYLNSKISKEIFKYDSSKSDFYKKIEDEFGLIEDRVRSEINKLDTDLKDKITELQELENKINKNNDSAIFVSLDKGYRGLFRAKVNERKNAFIWTCVLGFLVFLPAIIKVLGVKGWIDLPVYNIYGYIGSATITFILLYYFRVSYLNYNSIKTEITQIALRRNLCAFINGYSDFAKRNKNTPETLKQFENIIFSNIVSDSKNIPTTYDGIEQLAKLIISLKSRPTPKVD